MLQALLAEGRPLLADGATGTNLFAIGLTSGDSPELWNAAHPDRIQALGALVAPPAAETGGRLRRRGR